MVITRPERNTSRLPSKEFFGAPDRIRTCNLHLRRVAYYPVVLRVRAGILNGFIRKNNKQFISLVTCHLSLKNPANAGFFLRSYYSAGFTQLHFHYVFFGQSIHVETSAFSELGAHCLIFVLLIESLNFFAVW